MNIRTHALAAATLAALTLCLPALAAPGGRGGSGGHGAGGGFARLTQITGTITGLGTNTLTVTPTGGTATVLTVTSATTYTGSRTVTAADIALGDHLLVSGIPVTLQASSIVDTGTAATTTTTTGTTTTTTGTAAACPPGSYVPGALSVSGTVTALSPPTISVDNSSLSLALALTPATTFTRLSALTFADLASGQTVTAKVATSGATVTALQVKVTL